MTDEDYSNSDIPPHGEPSRDRELGGHLARVESLYTTKSLYVARQRYRIGVAGRRQMKEKLSSQQVTVIEWTARAARPWPIGIAAALLLTAATVMMTSPIPDDSGNNGESPAAALTSVSTGSRMLDALIAPMSSDSLLAMALATPVASRP